jgi:hypothetical protein
MVGVGGFGLIGLFSRQPSRGKGKTMYIVIKQSGDPEELKNESDMLKLFKNTDTIHIVKLLKEYHEDVGRGTVWGLDIKGRKIARIYLEFCEAGDMQAFIKKKDK